MPEILSSLSYIGFSKHGCFAHVQHEGTAATRAVEFTTTGWVRAAVGLNLHLLQDRHRFTCHLVQQFPLHQCLQSCPRACDVILLHGHSYSTNSCLHVAQANSSSHIGLGLFCPRNRTWKQGKSTVEKLRFLGKLPSLLQKCRRYATLKVTEIILVKVTIVLPCLQNWHCSEATLVFFLSQLELWDYHYLLNFTVSQKNEPRKTIFSIQRQCVAFFSPHYLHTLLIKKPKQVSWQIFIAWPLASCRRALRGQEHANTSASINTEARLCALKIDVIQEIFHTLTKALLRNKENTYSAPLLQELLSNPTWAYVAALPLKGDLQFPIFGWLYFHAVRNAPFQICIISQLGRNWPTGSKPRELLEEILKKHHLPLTFHNFSRKHTVLEVLRIVD